MCMNKKNKIKNIYIHIYIYTFFSFGAIFFFGSERGVAAAPPGYATIIIYSYPDLSS